MISAIKGVLEAAGPDWADVSVGGLTYRVNVSMSTVESLGRIGDQVHFLTILQVRDDGLMLYGFPTEESRRTFRSLIGINGVGPKVALGVLSRFTPQSLAEAVRGGDVEAFGRVPAVGKKTASRIVLELKGKLDGEWAVPSDVPGDADVIGALTAIGYSVSEAREAVSSLPPGDSRTVEEKVRLALQSLASL